MNLLPTYSRRKNWLLISRVLFNLLVPVSQPSLRLENWNDNKYANAIVKKILLGLPLQKPLESKLGDIKIIDKMEKNWMDIMLEPDKRYVPINILGLYLVKDILNPSWGKFSKAFEMIQPFLTVLLQ